MIISNSAGEKIIYPDLRIAPVPSGTRLTNVAKTLAKAGGLTFVSVFIPILHFVLVPVGVIVTAAMTYRAYQRNYLVENLEVHCPSCDKKTTQTVGGPQLPLRTICLSCGHMVYLTNEHQNV